MLFVSYKLGLAKVQQFFKLPKKTSPVRLAPKTKKNNS
nr:MAG TPA: hypothetical protein [Caudoviricetes sp.]